MKELKIGDPKNIIHKDETLWDTQIASEVLVAAMEEANSTEPLVVLDVLQKGSWQSQLFRDPMPYNENGEWDIPFVSLIQNMRSNDYRWIHHNYGGLKVDRRTKHCESAEQVKMNDPAAYNVKEVREEPSLLNMVYKDLYWVVVDRMLSLLDGSPSGLPYIRTVGAKQAAQEAAGVTRQFLAIFPAPDQLQGKSLHKITKDARRQDTCSRLQEDQVASYLKKFDDLCPGIWDHGQYLLRLLTCSHTDLGYKSYSCAFANGHDVVNPSIRNDDRVALSGQCIDPETNKTISEIDLQKPAAKILLRSLRRQLTPDQAIMVF